MEPLGSAKREQPEQVIQDAIWEYLERRGWHVERMVGNMYQKGVPDLWATHKEYGERWIEVKLPDMEGSRFTKAQLENFPKRCKNGSGVWVLTAATKTEYLKLFDSFNWWKYLH